MDIIPPVNTGRDHWRCQHSGRSRLLLRRKGAGSRGQELIQYRAKYFPAGEDPKLLALGLSSRKNLCINEKVNGAAPAIARAHLPHLGPQAAGNVAGEGCGGLMAE